MICVMCKFPLDYIQYFKMISKKGNIFSSISVVITKKPLDPPTWSAASMYEATRTFASNLKEKMAQRFYNLILLPRIRDDLAEYKRLNFHLYQALRKALYKPGAFMKGKQKDRFFFFYIYSMF